MIICNEYIKNLFENLKSWAESLHNNIGLLLLTGVQIANNSSCFRFTPFTQLICGVYGKGVAYVMQDR